MPEAPAPMSGPMTCEVCGTGLAACLDPVIDPQTGDRFRIDRCATCGVGRTVPQPVDLMPYYGAQYHGGRHGVTERMCMARRLRFVAEVAKPGRVLDFGCGDGGFLSAVQGAGWTGIGVEMKPEQARERGLSVVEDMAEVDGTFDVITLWHCLEHVRSPRETLELLYPSLKAGGHLLVAVPNWGSWQARLFGRNWFHNDVPRHLTHFTPDGMGRLFGAVGLRQVKAWNLEAEIDYFGWPQSMLNSVLADKNVLFDVVTGRKRAHSAAAKATSLALGSVFSAASLPLFLAAAATPGKGAIMVFAAQRPA